MYIKIFTLIFPIILFLIWIIKTIGCIGYSYKEWKNNKKNNYLNSIPGLHYGGAKYSGYMPDVKKFTYFKTYEWYKCLKPWK